VRLRPIVAFDPPPHRDVVKRSCATHLLRVTRLTLPRTIGGPTYRVAAATGARSRACRVRHAAPGQHTVLLGRKARQAIAELG
jgi:hypothetical protein